MDHYAFLGNSSPTPPLTQHFVLSDNKLGEVGSFPETHCDRFWIIMRIRTQPQANS